MGVGEPNGEYPLRWSVYTWLEGTTPTPELIADPVDTAESLAGFIKALGSVDPTGGPPPARRGLPRGQSLALCDRATRDGIGKLVADFDPKELTRSWDAALTAAEWGRPGAWLHGDLYSANLLATEGRITGVIDWEGMAVGDPAADLTVAWDLLDADARAVFRRAVDVDDATWARGRGWALAMGVVGLPYYRTSNIEFALLARRLIGEVLADR
jgi:aminoglycoside phosphotransferase (APT) family kinase protein